jgi:hypothetical protein
VASRTENTTDSKEIHNLTTYTFLRFFPIILQTNNPLKPQRKDQCSPKRRIGRKRVEVPDDMHYTWGLLGS